MKRAFFLSALIAFGVAVANPVSPGVAQAAPAQREFTVIAANSPLYSHLQTVQGAGWTSLIAENQDPPISSGLTRYEMALEAAKAVFTLQARQQAGSLSRESTRIEELQSLRALCVGLKMELLRLDVRVDSAITLLDQLIKTRSSELATANSSTPQTSLSFSSTPRRDLENTVSEREVSLPLSRRLRVHGALSPLTRERNTFWSASSENASPDIFRLKTPTSKSNNMDGEVGTTLSLSKRLRLRTSAEQRAPQFLFAENSVFPDTLNLPGDGSPMTRSLGSGVDFAVLPGVIFSGNVAHVSGFDLDSTPGGASVDGTRFSGGIDFSGWQNRVALSAHLARLVPEDSPAFGTTAAQLNLGVEVTRQIQLNLLFRQMFDNPQNSGGARQISGGININF